MQTISERELRNRGGEYLRRVATGESFAVTHNGVVVACLTPPSRSGLDDAVARGQMRAATAPVSTLRRMRRRKSGLSSAKLLVDEAESDALAAEELGALTLAGPDYLDVLTSAVTTAG